MGEAAASTSIHLLRRRAAAGVLRHAAQGLLPPFAWRMGLDESDWLALAADCAQGPTRADGRAAPRAPLLAQELAGLLLAQRSAGADRRHARWLAHTIAAASYGGRHLWQDLGLDGREQVSLLIGYYFDQLFARNTQNVKWKRFLYQQLGAAQGRASLQPPGCRSCEEFQRCFPGPRPPTTITLRKMS